MNKKIKKKQGLGANSWAIKNYSKMTSQYTFELVKDILSNLLGVHSKIETSIEFSNFSKDYQYFFLFLDDITGGHFEEISKKFKNTLSHEFGNNKRLARIKNAFLKNSEKKNFWDDFFDIKCSKDDGESVMQTDSESTDDVFKKIYSWMRAQTISAQTEIINSELELNEIEQNEFVELKNTEMAYEKFSEAVLSEELLTKNIYPMNEEGYLHTSSFPEQQKKILSIDCEMVNTTCGIELAQISIVDFEFRTIYQKYVKPSNEIVDYLSAISGISAETYQQFEYVSLEQVQKDLQQLIGPKTVLIGHGLENDFRALKIVHLNCVDTAILFQKASHFKFSLKNLAFEHLNLKIQDGSHDPSEDARVALALSRLKLQVYTKYPKHMIMSGLNNIDFLNFAHEKMKVALFDFEFNAKKLLKSNIYYESITQPDEVLKKMIKYSKKERSEPSFCQLVFGRFILNQNHEFEDKINSLDKFISELKEVQKESKICLCVTTTSYRKPNPDGLFGYDLCFLI